MDFWVGSFDGLVGSDTNTAATTTPTGSSCLASLVSSDPEAKQKWYGSGFLEQARSGTNEDDWRSSKLCKTESTLLQQKISTISPPPPSGLSFTRTDDGQKEAQMLSFSCPKSEPFSVDRSSQNSTSFPFFHLSSSAYNDINTGYINSGSFNGGNMQLGAFTHSQWMELEQQALVYKYMTANVPIPSNLLIPIRKDVESARLSCFPASLMRPNGLRWEAFHLGYSGNTDPEPGRCRRTDGKKWRCSRDAVPDHKYCERHMNRGRHRSRKPVEGQSGHLAAVSTATTMIKNAKLTTSTSAVTMVVGPQGGSMSNSLPLQHRQLEDFQTAGLNTSLSRTFLDKENLVTADSLLSTSNKSSPLMKNGGNFGCSEGLTGRNVVQHSLHEFMDDLPNKSQSDCSVVSWPQLDLHSDRPQLSISIPTTTADYMSVTSSPNNETTTLLPLRLSCKFDPIQMGLGVGRGLNEPKQRQANWIPISWWGTSVGGPLGEVLNNTGNSSSGECKNSSAMNLMTEGWESSPRMESSPTGVLQKSTFCSLSNSSAGSSPRADNTKTSESASLCNDRDSALVQQSS